MGGLLFFVFTLGAGSVIGAGIALGSRSPVARGIGLAIAVPSAVFGLGFLFTFTPAGFLTGAIGLAGVAAYIYRAARPLPPLDPDAPLRFPADRPAPPRAGF